jgi:hypothetical protein
VRKTLQWEGVGGLYKGVTSPLAGQMFFRATLFSAFGASKRWLGTNADGSTRALETLDFFKAGFITGAAAAFTEAPIDFYKSQIQVQILRSRADPTYKGECGGGCRACLTRPGVGGRVHVLGGTLPCLCQQQAAGRGVVSCCSECCHRACVCVCDVSCGLPVCLAVAWR